MHIDLQMWKSNTDKNTSLVATRSCPGTRFLAISQALEEKGEEVTIQLRSTLSGDYSVCTGNYLNCTDLRNLGKTAAIPLY